MAMPFCDNLRCVVSYFYFKLQSFRENIYAFKLFKMDGCSYFMVCCINECYQFNTVVYRDERVRFFFFENLDPGIVA